MKSPLFALASAAVAGALVLTLSHEGGAQEGPQVGYDDTPYLPDQEWRVHDKARPRPPVVQPGVGTAPPSDAIVLFDGSDVDAWSKGDGSPAHWRIDGDAMVVSGGGGIKTRESFGDVQLHIEWATPSEVKGDSQGRGNSGVILMGRYEIQVLDSYENPSYADGQAAAMYGQFPPLVNSSRGPGEWQSYDILFETPRWENGELVRPARATVLHNGVVVHHAIEFLGATRHAAVAEYAEHGPTGPIQLQDHGNPVRFRNVWVRPLGQ